MSTFGGLIRYVSNKSSKSKSGRLSREAWEKKLRDEGKWIDHKKKS